MLTIKYGRFIKIKDHDQIYLNYCNAKKLNNNYKFWLKIYSLNKALNKLPS